MRCVTYILAALVFGCLTVESSAQTNRGDRLYTPVPEGMFHLAADKAPIPRRKKTEKPKLLCGGHYAYCTSDADCCADWICLTGDAYGKQCQ